MQTISSTTRAAMDYLSKRNPLHISQKEYFKRLVDFAATHGDTALEALAGFYVYTQAAAPAEHKEFIIGSTFAHDLGDIRPDRLPRSLSFRFFWPPLMPN